MIDMLRAKDREGKLGIVECTNDETTGELVCKLVDLRDPSVKFSVSVAETADGELRITNIRTEGNKPIPDDIYDDLQVLLTKLTKGKIPIEEL